MRITGYCTSCHKIRNVTVNMSQWAGRGVPTGICTSCERAEEAKRTGRQR